MPTPMAIIVATEVAQSGTSTRLASKRDESGRDADAEDRGEDGQAHRQQGAEADQQDDGGDEEADAFAADFALLGALHGVAGELDHEAVAIGVVGGVEQLAGDLDRHVPGVELEGGEGDAAVVGDAVGISRRYGSATLATWSSAVASSSSARTPRSVAGLVTSSALHTTSIVSPDPPGTARRAGRWRLPIRIRACRSRWCRRRRSVRRRSPWPRAAANQARTTSAAAAVDESGESGDHGGCLRCQRGDVAAGCRA